MHIIFFCDSIVLFVNYKNKRIRTYLLLVCVPLYYGV